MCQIEESNNRGREPRSRVGPVPWTSSVANGRVWDDERAAGAVPAARLSAASRVRGCALRGALEVGGGANARGVGATIELRSNGAILGGGPRVVGARRRVREPVGEHVETSVQRRPGGTTHRGGGQRLGGVGANGFPLRPRRGGSHAARRTGRGRENGTRRGSHRGVVSCPRGVAVPARCSRTLRAGYGVVVRCRCA